MLWALLAYMDLIWIFTIDISPNTVNPRYTTAIVPKDVAIKMNLLLYRKLNEQIDM